MHFFWENNTVAVTFSPHSSHIIQPLDSGSHNILKEYYNEEREKWFRSHLGRAITAFQITPIFV